MTPLYGPLCSGMCLPGARIENIAVCIPGTAATSRAVSGQRAQFASERNPKP